MDEMFFDVNTNAFCIANNDEINKITERCNKELVTNGWLSRYHWGNFACSMCYWDDKLQACPDNCWKDHRCFVSKTTEKPVYFKPFGDFIDKVIFNDPATIVIWADGTKTIVKCQDGDVFDPEKGLAMALSKKFLGSTYEKNWYDIFKKYLEDNDD